MAFFPFSLVWNASYENCQGSWHTPLALRRHDPLVLVVPRRLEGRRVCPSRLEVSHAISASSPVKLFSAFILLTCIPDLLFEVGDLGPESMAFFRK